MEQEKTLRIKLRYFLREITWLNGMDHGWGNGYVLIPVGHPLHNMDYDKIPVDVHGGLTFGEIVTKEMVDRWNTDMNDTCLTNDDIGAYLIGFDTAHLDDTQYNWPKEAVEQETQELVKQIETKYVV